MKPVARTEAILTESLGSELVVYDERAKKAHRLNSTAAFLWRNCDGTRSVSDLAKLLHDKMGLPQDGALVSLALEALGKRGLIDESFSANGVSRREAIRKLKALGVAAAMIPIVATVTAPLPAAAVSLHHKPTSSSTRATPASPKGIWEQKQAGSTSGEDDVNVKEAPQSDLFDNPRNSQADGARQEDKSGPEPLPPWR